MLLEIYCIFFLCKFNILHSKITLQMANPQLTKKLGQHILINQSIISSIITRSNIKSTDTILEIGPGTGNLTIPMLHRAKKLICIEKDPRLASELLKKVQSLKLTHKFELIVGDALKIDFPHFDLCISNTPYQISSPLTFKLLNCTFRSAVLMFQREFAERMVARPGQSQYCRLSVAVQLRARVDHLLKVGRKCFMPVPDVESSVVRIELKRKVDVGWEFEKFLKICFLRKNRTLKAIFKKEAVSAIQENGGRVDDVLKGGYGDRRANKMDVEDFLELFLNMKKKDIKFK